MAKFLLLLHENPKDFQNLPPEEMQAMFERYRAWGQSVAKPARWRVATSSRMRADATCGRTAAG